MSRQVFCQRCGRPLRKTGTQYVATDDHPSLAPRCGDQYLCERQIGQPPEYKPNGRRPRACRKTPKGIF